MVINYTSRGRCIDAKLYLNIKLDLQTQILIYRLEGGWRFVDKLYLHPVRLPLGELRPRATAYRNPEVFWLCRFSVVSHSWSH